MTSHNVRGNTVPDNLTEFVQTASVSNKQVDTEYVYRISQQAMNEYSSARQHINKLVQNELKACEGLEDILARIVRDVKQWANLEYYESKQLRLKKLVKDEELLFDVMFQLVCLCSRYDEKPELLSSIMGQGAYKLTMFTEHRDRLITTGELLSHLHRYGLIEITRIEAGGIGANFGRESLAMQSRIVLSKTTKNFIENSMKLLPLVEPPVTVTNNQQCGYHTFNDPVTLNGTISGKLALDVINIQNQTALAISTDFLLNQLELPNKEFDTAEQEKQWAQFMAESQQAYLQLLGQSDRIWFDYKYDLRGRMYASGYHLNPQGAPYKKAMLEFADKEYIEVPEQYRRQPT